jgi:hypothetical protein
MDDEFEEGEECIGNDRGLPLGWDGVFCLWDLCYGSGYIHDEGRRGNGSVGRNGGTKNFISKEETENTVWLGRGTDHLTTCVTEALEGSDFLFKAWIERWAGERGCVVVHYEVGD